MSGNTEDVGRKIARWLIGQADMLAHLVSDPRELPPLLQAIGRQIGSMDWSSSEPAAGERVATGREPMVRDALAFSVGTIETVGVDGQPTNFQELAVRYCSSRGQESGDEIVRLIAGKHPVSAATMVLCLGDTPTETQAGFFFDLIEHMGTTAAAKAATAAVAGDGPTSEADSLRERMDRLQEPEGRPDDIMKLLAKPRNQF